jgi:hypothetical protein
MLSFMTDRGGIGFILRVPKFKLTCSDDIFVMGTLSGAGITILVAAAERADWRARVAGKDSEHSEG